MRHFVSRLQNLNAYINVDGEGGFTKMGGGQRRKVAPDFGAGHTFRVSL
jgi:hypothetical protein